MTTFAVTGATGQLGRLVIEQLKSRVPAEQIIALVRNPNEAKELGVAVREGDYDKPEVLEKSLQGVDKLLLISGLAPGLAGAEQHKNVINAAKKAGVKYIAYTSLINLDHSPFEDLAPKHQETEKALKASGLDYTILRHGWYTENYTASVQPAIANGAFYGSAKEGKISSVPRADLAEADAIVLSSEGHNGKTYELAGDTAYTLTELAAEISKQTGKDIPYVDVPQADYEGALKQAGLPDWLAEGLAYWDTCAAQNALFSEDKTLSQLLGRPTTDLAAAIKAAL
ncbi:NAD(P)H dehydrogenase (quinone) [Cricetibacter osteomyelitidis]|uniref:NAD(P)H dehydrogenase (Quinone) n=1 Tax=Cricetibacter osteomyelitidis TaxID=1521931 RepID=A0A4R2SZJ4_9PAST|nr:SDR family oxidoreductase [Cricetibacter osteomyelitidis]TCP90078.1 NAD(P)H dehydrogenase (quinone) [Cricetibacter osteomyelitidis]